MCITQWYPNIFSWMKNMCVLILRLHILNVNNLPAYFKLKHHREFIFF